uniref:Uncharacterized protein n=1 Tax=Glossina pallidipes TaxID=7398 RepID=A0A1B0AEL0_GLOPL
MLNHSPVASVTPTPSVPSGVNPFVPATSVAATCDSIRSVTIHISFLVEGKPLPNTNEPSCKECKAWARSARDEPVSRICESVNTHSKSSNIKTSREANNVQSDKRFRIVMRQRAWFVNKRNGVRDLSCVELASMRTVCQDNSLKINIIPLYGSLRRVKRKSPFAHLGVFDSTRIRDICKVLK